MAKLGFSGLGVSDLLPKGGLAVAATVVILGAVDGSIGVPSGAANKRRSGWYLPLRHLSTTCKII